jgi:hypothetical protein
MVEPIAPRYGEAALADLVPSMLAALGVPGFVNSLAIGPVRQAVLLVADGLGFELIRRHAELAPFLSRALAASRPLTTGFPSTTSVSLSSIGTGLPPGQHGVVGYTMALPQLPRAMNTLQWALHGRPADDLREVVVPETFFKGPTAFERAVAAGVSVDLVGPVELAHTGLSRSTLRGGRYRGTRGGRALVDDAVAALREPGPRGAFVYAYHPTLDGRGHAFGIDSPEWRDTLTEVDQIVQRLANAMPLDSVLVVTGDHGMVDVPKPNQIDMADHEELRTGVRFLGGEARARHVYTRPGAAPDVLATWREVLGPDWWVVPRQEAIAGGWFGPVLAEAVQDRIGDVVAAAHGPYAVMQREVFRPETAMIGHHGSMTADEALVPQMVFRR